MLDILYNKLHTMQEFIYLINTELSIYHVTKTKKPITKYNIDSSRTEQKINSSTPKKIRK